MQDSYLGKISHFRAVAAENWARTMNTWAQQYPALPQQLPGYFIDQYGYSIYLATRSPKPEPIQVPNYDVRQAAAEWWTVVEKGRKALPGRGMQLPEMSSSIPASDYALSLFDKWRGCLSQSGIAYPYSMFRLNLEATWESYYKNSIFYPQRPALLTLSFFENLSRNQQDRLLRRYGPLGVWGFYLFMQQVHEEFHMLQTGEPLLNELMFAKLWCQFLTDVDLWAWQVNEETGVSCNLERPWLDRLSMAERDFRIALLDTRQGVAKLFEYELSYDIFCSLANLLHSKTIRYRTYLDCATRVFAMRQDVTWLRLRCESSVDPLSLAKSLL
ncbi:hypothetical protein Pan153_24190 [Gimesia panareensis]|uniref:Uncharacterized protein n=1 Tax=Gimesia panareensis TaxID=2527978 RepID=A0A518FN35_9PLAN|nr:hypothetical protein Pan153_24190 [Gimesia panareensis]